VNVSPLKFPAYWLLSIILFSGTGLSADPGDDLITEQPLVGKTVLEVLKVYSQQGIKLLFSTDYIPPDLTVLSEPVSSDPLQLIDEILKPHALELREVDGSYLIVKVMQDAPENSSPSLLIVIRNLRAPSTLAQLQITTEPEILQHQELGPGLYEFFPSEPGVYFVKAELPGYRISKSKIRIEANDSKLLSIEFEPGPAELETLSVSASRYLLLSSSQFVVNQRALQAQPSIGEDPIRSAQRLQGTATGGFSAKSHFRGGAVNETSIYLNGAKLIEPFHIRNFYNIFSAIDVQAISSMQVYTGGFPAEYGDNMSGLLMLDSKLPKKPLKTEIGLSVFYTSILNTGYSKEGRYDWLVSARRSNLNVVLGPTIGEPQYFDIFTTLGFNPNPDTRISFNALLTDDDVTVYLESDPSELEKSDSESTNKTFWLTVEKSWGENLSASTTVLTSEFTNLRLASVNDPEKIVASVFDDRKIVIHSLRHLMEYKGLSNHYLKWGVEFSQQKASFNYAAQAEYTSLAGGFPGLESPLAYTVEANPAGNAYAVFFSDRFTVNDQLSLELGLRWDKQTYTNPTYAGQLSPRGSVLYRLGNGHSFRFTVGRYYQSQPIQELQVEDNISHYYKPQYADHMIAGYQWAASKAYKFRLEAYYKNYRRLAPRFENLFDPIQLVPELQSDRVRLDPDSASARGIEIGIEYDANKAFNWWASYTLSRVTDSIGGISIRRSWDQLHAFQFGLGWRRGAWEFGLAARINSGWPTTGLNLNFDSESGEPVLILGPRNGQQLSTFASLDFRLSREFDVRIGKLTGFLEATNASNRKNLCCTENTVKIDSEGNYFLDREISYWLPIIPSIGLLWEF